MATAHDLNREHHIGDQLFLFKPYLQVNLATSRCEICDQQLRYHNWVVLDKDGFVHLCSFNYPVYYLVDQPSITMNASELFDQFFLSIQTGQPYLLLWQYSFNAESPWEIWVRLDRVQHYRRISVSDDVQWTDCDRWRPIWNQ